MKEQNIFGQNKASQGSKQRWGVHKSELKGHLYPKELVPKGRKVHTTSHVRTNGSIKSCPNPHTFSLYDLINYTVTVHTKNVNKSIFNKKILPVGRFTHKKVTNFKTAGSKTLTKELTGLYS